MAIKHPAEGASCWVHIGQRLRARLMMVHARLHDAALVGQATTCLLLITVWHCSLSPGMSACSFLMRLDSASGFTWVRVGAGGPDHAACGHVLTLQSGTTLAPAPPPTSSRLKRSANSWSSLLDTWLRTASLRSNRRTRSWHAVGS